MTKKRELRIVQDGTYEEKPFMVVEYFRGENNYVGHKVLARFSTYRKASNFKQKEARHSSQA